MSTPHNEISRRDFVKHLAAGVAVTALVKVNPLRAEPTGRTRTVLAMSDLHMGLKADAVDGTEWLARALKEVKENKLPVDYALVLGDLAHTADPQTYKLYTDLRDKSGIAKWFELAGNHDYREGNVKDYEKAIRPIKPHSFVDGNVAWFFISDEGPGTPGEVTDETIEWLNQGLEEHRSDIVIVCSHQLVYDTVRKSTGAPMHLHPKEKIEKLIADHRVDLWLAGHQHSQPYAAQDFIRKGRTTYINVASLSHAYNTKQSQSFLLELADGSTKITARRRVHDDQKYDDHHTVTIPLDRPIRLGNG